jgi:hypothetical protein
MSDPFFRFFTEEIYVLTARDAVSVPRAAQTAIQPVVPLRRCLRKVAHPPRHHHLAIHPGDLQGSREHVDIVLLTSARVHEEGGGGGVCRCQLCLS